MSSQITVGPPDLKSVDAKSLAVANYLRHHPLLKQREGFLNGQRQQFWRIKRAVRALDSDDYKKKQAKNANLPPINSSKDAMEALRQFPFNRFAFNVDKLETAEAIRLGQKPAPGVPVLKVSATQEFGDDQYFVWFYEPVKMTTYLYGIGMLAVVFAVVLFPLWPIKMRIGVWYLSMGMLGVLGAFFGLAIIRLIIFCVSWAASPRTFWLFPNLFEDVGFFDSFKPVYAFSDQLQTLSQQRAAEIQKQKKKKALKKEKRAKKQQVTAAKSAAQGLSGSSSPVAPGQQGPVRGAPPPGAIKISLTPAQQKELNDKAENIKRQIAILRQNIMASPQGPKTPEQQQQLDAQLTQQMNKKLQEEFGKVARKALQDQAAAAGAAAAGSPTAGGQSDKITPISESQGSTSTKGASTEPVQRKVVLEDAED